MIIVIMKGRQEIRRFQRPGESSRGLHQKEYWNIMTELMK